MRAISAPDERAAFAAAVRQAAGGSVGSRDHFGDGSATAASVDDELWRILVEQLDLSALVIAAPAGGADGRYADLAVAFEVLGSSLAPVPALASCGMATAVLGTLESDTTVDGLLRRLASGHAVGTVAWPHSGGLDAPLSPTIRATPAAGGVVELSGTVAFVLNGMEADFLLVPATAGDTLVLTAVEAEAAGMIRRPMTTLDLTRGMSELVLDAAPAVVLADRDAAASALEIGLDLTLALLATEQVGVAQICLDSAVTYVKDRVQFDRPIGSFQAVKHKLVDLLLQLELARAAADAAISAADAYLDEPTPQAATALRAAASMAKAMAGESGAEIARETLHLFGGIGFTWEHQAHLYYRRALANQEFLGGPALYRVRLAAAVGV